MNGSGPGAAQTADHATVSYYVAFGDSLAAGYQTASLPTDRGCKDHRADATGSKGYACLVFNSLRKAEPSLRLKNFGLASTPGEDSCSFQHVTNCSGAKTRRNVAKNDIPPFPINSESQLAAGTKFLGLHQGQVKVISLDMGGNDFGSLLSAGLETNVQKARTQIPAVLKRFRANIVKILHELRRAAPHATVIVANQYNPLSGVPALLLGAHGKEIKKLTATTLGHLATIVRSAAAKAHGVVADELASFAGRAESLTHVLTENIHPTASGYKRYAAVMVKAAGEGTNKKP